MKLADQKQLRIVRVNPFFNTKGVPLEMSDSFEGIQQQTPQEIQMICINCQKWLRNQTKVKTETDYYCVGCFSKVLPSCNFYQIIGHDSFDVLGSGWPARHDLLMLMALQKFGFGNWVDVQQYMGYLGANYYKDQIQYHYNKFYGNHWEEQESNIVSINLTKVPNPSRKYRKSGFRGGKSVERSTWICMQKKYDQNLQEIPCYNTRRQQFNIEYNENLQKYLADLEFRDNDSQKEIELKFEILESYNEGLQDRLEKHNFIREYKLLDENYQAEEAEYFQLNPFAAKANQMLIDLMRAMTREQFLQLRQSLQFCLRIQSLVDGIREVRATNPNCSLLKLSSLEKQTEKQIEELGKPKKRVHRNPQDKFDKEQKAILKRLNVKKDELKAIIDQANEQGQPVIYKGIKITPMRYMVDQQYEQCD